jgi:glycosyltransferase involved in cell wall biosynthesis
VARHADRIITVSSASRAAIFEAVGSFAPPIVDCGVAITELDRSGALPAGLIKGEYYFFCGLAEPRKNLPRLIASWVASETRRPLVLAGPDLAALPPQDGLVLLPYQSRPALMELLASARALLFPTLAEGFGLPVAEAMALGTPVLTSNAGGAAETAGKAALTVDPSDKEAITAAIRLLDADDELCARLIDAGRRRARAFSPAVFGERLLRLHEEFAGDSRLARYAQE